MSEVVQLSDFQWERLMEVLWATHQRLDDLCGLLQRTEEVLAMLPLEPVGSPLFQAKELGNSPFTATMMAEAMPPASLREWHEKMIRAIQDSFIVPPNGDGENKASPREA